MTLKQIIFKIRVFGVKGIWNYFLRKRRTYKEEKRLRATCARAPSFKPEKGFSLLGDFCNSTSLSKVLRDCARTLKESGIPYQTYQTSHSVPRVPQEEYENILTPNDQFVANRFTWTLGMERKFGPYASHLHAGQIYFWEFEDGFLAHHQHLVAGDHVIAFSDFNAHVFRTLLPQTIHVHKLLYPFHFETPTRLSRTTIREKFGIRTTDFVVFFNFDYRSSYHRKNPEDLVDAFAEAFPNQHDVRLVLKTMRSQHFPHAQARLQQKIRALGLGDQVIFINSYLSQNELVSLTAASDVYASLHRGEGFGLGIAEAMKMGVSVLVSDYSAPTEFCTSKSAYLIPISLVPTPREQMDTPFYHGVTHWAQPDVHAAARGLQKLYSDPAFRHALGQRGQTYINQYYAPQRVAQSFQDFLAST